MVLCLSRGCDKDMCDRRYHSMCLFAEVIHVVLVHFSEDEYIVMIGVWSTLKRT